MAAKAEPRGLTPEEREGFLEVLRRTDDQGEAVLDWLEANLPWRCVFSRPAPRLVTELVAELAGEEGLRIIGPQASPEWIAAMVERSRKREPSIYSLWDAGFRYYRQIEQTEAWLREDEFPDEPEKLEAALAAWREGGIPALRRWFNGVEA
jgi:hypothetical protein